jgi:hypothetical protein
MSYGEPNESISMLTVEAGVICALPYNRFLLMMYGKSSVWMGSTHAIEAP